MCLHFAIFMWSNAYQVTRTCNPKPCFRTNKVNGINASREWKEYISSVSAPNCFVCRIKIVESSWVSNTNRARKKSVYFHSLWLNDEGGDKGYEDTSARLPIVHKLTLVKEEPKISQTKGETIYWRRVAVSTLKMVCPSHQRANFLMIYGIFLNEQNVPCHFLPELHRDVKP